MMKKSLMFWSFILALALSPSYALAGVDKAGTDKPSKEAPEKPSKETPDKPDPCKDVPDKVKEAADHFGHGDFGTAAEKLGEAAGAAFECVRDR
jgi:hypothetical protein